MSGATPGDCVKPIETPTARSRVVLSDVSKPFDDPVARRRMSTRAGGTDGGTVTGESTVGVGVELAGLSQVRAGVSRGQMSLPEGSTVVDAVERLAEQHGRPVRPALLQDSRLRQDTVALRRVRGGWERVPGSEQLEHGDRIRFEVSD
jgi:hypothetical protein